jgi:hypothetical protein
VGAIRVSLPSHCLSMKCFHARFFRAAGFCSFVDAPSRDKHAQLNFHFIILSGSMTLFSANF